MDPTAIGQSPAELPPYWPGIPASAELPCLAPEDEPNIDDLVTQDDVPLDNIPQGKQQRLLVNSLYASWRPPEGRTFAVEANVGLFFALKKPPLVPDVYLSLDVSLPPAGKLPKHYNSYFFWVHAKPPDVVIEIVSNREGGEAGDKLRLYSQIGVKHYVIFDPDNWLGDGILRAFTLQATGYAPIDSRWLPAGQIGLTLWDGTHEGYQRTWIRWCDAQGNLIPLAEEDKQLETERAGLERQRADAADQRANQERERADRLAAQLKSLTEGNPGA